MTRPLQALTARVLFEQKKQESFICALTESYGPIRIYPRSIHSSDDAQFFIFRDGRGLRRLGCLSPRPKGEGLEWDGEERLADGNLLFAGSLSDSNAEAIRTVFPFTAPVLVGRRPSFGFGDRLGLANPGHLRAMQGRKLAIVLAQQSIRELERTDRTAEEVLSVATFAVLQEGHHDGFGADGDHLKTKDHIDQVLRAGYTMFTFDPGEHVDNEADHLGATDLRLRVSQLPWSRLGESFTNLKSRYLNRSIELGPLCQLDPSEEDILRAVVKYGRVIHHVKRMFDHLRGSRTLETFEVELSVDETDSVTTPFEHLLVVSELQRLHVRIDGLAPRFVGRFEKGVDFRGSLEEFEAQYRQHAAVAARLGPYKLSLHSGSDKFSLYPLINKNMDVSAHVKTAGTSYLEALRAIATVEPDLFREILDFSRQRYSQAKSSYHVSADLAAVPAGTTLSDSESLELFDSNDDARQVLHVAFGDVLTSLNKGGEFRYRDRLIKLLDDNEETHFACLERHFKRHLDPLL